MIRGHVNDEGVPWIEIPICSEHYVGVVDTGFNLGLELLFEMKGNLNDQPVGDMRFALGADQQVVQDAYLVDFPVDSRIIRTVATYIHTDTILIGTMVLYE